jgi:hypothetical protein
LVSTKLVVHWASGRIADIDRDTEVTAAGQRLRELAAQPINDCATLIAFEVIDYKGSFIQALDFDKRCPDRNSCDLPGRSFNGHTGEASLSFLVLPSHNEPTFGVIGKQDRHFSVESPNIFSLVRTERFYDLCMTCIAAEESFAPI